MAYLAVTIEQVLHNLKEQREIEETSRQRQIERERVQRNEELSQAQDEADWARKVSLFNHRFPPLDEQMQEIQKTVPLLFQGPELRKNIAISNRATESKIE